MIRSRSHPDTIPAHLLCAALAFIVIAAGLLGAGAARAQSVPGDGGPDEPHGAWGDVTVMGAWSAQGAMLGSLIAVHDNGICEDLAAVTTCPMVGGVAGLTAGVVLNRIGQNRLSNGALATYGALQGNLVSYQIHTLASPDPNGEHTALLMMAGGTGGLLAGHVLGNRRDVSGVRALAMTETAVIGSLTGLLAGDAVSRHADVKSFARVNAATSLAGSLAGSYLGYRWGRSSLQDVNDALLYGYAPIATGFGGAAIGRLGGSDWESAGAAMGGVVGLGVGRWLAQRRAWSLQEITVPVGGSLAMGAAGALGASRIQDDPDVNRMAFGTGILVGFAGSVLYELTHGTDESRAEDADASGVKAGVRFTPSIPTVPGDDGRPIRLADEVAPQVQVSVRF